MFIFFRNQRMFARQQL